MTTPLQIRLYGTQARFVYSDALLPLMAHGEAVTRRASHVEPDSASGWTADMSPVKGPVLGPFKTRSEALLSEAAWLADRGIPIPRS